MEQKDSPPTLEDLKKRLHLKKRIGLLGGSFNPPHEGHIHLSETACLKLGLDEIWWLVTPGNPFKNRPDYNNYKGRVTHCQNFVSGRKKITVLDIEGKKEFSRTIDTLGFLKDNLPKAQFVWLAGMDIAHQMSSWLRWREIIKKTSICFVARQPWTSISQRTAFSNFSRAEIYQEHLESPRKVDLSPGHIYWIKQVQVNLLSSTEIRKLDFHSNNGIK
ncbi:MAG: hypothetical protein CL565_03720 [Alphaproteobacteria bacterium]|nr:hypothetical protein [Alphaproteobacteria bacterium]